MSKMRKKLLIIIILLGFVIKSAGISYALRPMSEAHKKELAKAEFESRTIEELSWSVSLTSSETYLDVNLLRVLFVANLISAIPWQWKSEKPLSRAYEPGVLLSVGKRIRKIMTKMQKHFTFMQAEKEASGDFWGMIPKDWEKARLTVTETFFREVSDRLVEELAAGGTLDEPYIRNILHSLKVYPGLEPRLKNETIDLMQAFSRITDNKKGLGKCVGLAGWWAAVLSVWGEFDPNNIFIIATDLHVYVLYLDEEHNIIFSNTYYVLPERLEKESKDSDPKKRARALHKRRVLGSEKGEEVCVLSIGGCFNQRTGVSTLTLATLEKVLGAIKTFGIKLHINTDGVEFRPQEAGPILNPLDFEDVEAYRGAVLAEAQKRPDSIYARALYAYRSLEVKRPEAFLLAALREVKTQEKATELKGLEGAVSFVKGIEGTKSIFDDENRIALPDEVLLFNTGSHKDKALMLYTLLWHMGVAKNNKLFVTFDANNSYVFCNGNYIDTHAWQSTSSRPELTKEARTVELRCFIPGDKSKGIVYQPLTPNRNGDGSQGDGSQGDGSQGDGSEHEKPPDLQDFKAAGRRFLALIGSAA